jgi:hypothetical protein
VLEADRHQIAWLRTNSGSFATFAAIRRASSRVNSPTARKAGVFRKPQEREWDQQETYEIKLS